MKILAIETSCDETAIAFVECDGGIQNPSFAVRAHVVATQIAIHRPFGGVVPSLAKREHLKNLPIVFEQVTNQLKTTRLASNPSRLGQSEADARQENYKLEPDRIAVTIGPGLEPALWTGINFAKELAEKLGAPLIGVNHLEGHIYSNWLEPKTIAFPAIVLLVSGGHTVLLVMDSMQKWRKLGETQDDAAGEAFDKVAKMLGLPYPGGPEVERMAQGGNPDAIPFPRPMMHSGDFNFSFSGLKTAVLYHIRNAKNLINHESAPPAGGMNPSDVCASFQKAAIDVLCVKTMRAAEENGAETVLLCGGVASNKALASELERRATEAGMRFSAPPREYNTDNAVMIAAAAYCGHAHPVETALPNLNI